MSRPSILPGVTGGRSIRELALDKAVELALRCDRPGQLDARGFSELGSAHLYKKRHDDRWPPTSGRSSSTPNDADILAEMAKRCLARVSPRRAIDLLERAMRLNPYYPGLVSVVSSAKLISISATMTKAVHTLQRRCATSRRRTASWQPATPIWAGQMKPLSRQTGDGRAPGLFHRALAQGAAGQNPEARSAVDRGLIKAGLRTTTSLVRLVVPLPPPGIQAAGRATVRCEGPGPRHVCGRSIRAVRPRAPSNLW